MPALSVLIIINVASLRSGTIQEKTLCVYLFLLCTHIYTTHREFIVVHWGNAVTFRLFRNAFLKNSTFFLRPTIQPFFHGETNSIGKMNVESRKVGLKLFRFLLCVYIPSINCVCRSSS